ncbi:MAG: ABC transporter ATP-binding protein [Deefgea sp.]
MSLLSLKNFTIQQGERVLVANLNWSISAGETWLVLGENGCGKSTLLSAMAGWHQPVAGELQLNDQPWRSVPNQRRAQAMAWQTQHDEHPFPMTVLEKVLTGRHPHLSRFAWESQQDIALARQQLARLDLAHLEARDLATLSGGERRRVSLATILTQQAPLMLLDEPLSQLDVRHQQQALRVLAQDPNQATVLVTHDPNHAHGLCAQTTFALLLYGDGRFLAGLASEVLTAENLSALYHYPIQAFQLNERPWFVATN